MPIFEYQCSKCSERFEKIHGATEKNLKITCPKCGDPSPQRVISAFCCGGPRSGDTGSTSACGPRPTRFS